MNERKTEATPYRSWAESPGYQNSSRLHSARRAASDGEKYPSDGVQAIWAFDRVSDNSGMTAHEGNAAVTPPPDRLMRLKEVLELTSLRRATLYNKIKEGTFPRQVRISARGAAWREAAIRAWLENPTRWSASEA
jgi:prophage regulatory protein